VRTLQGTPTPRRKSRARRRVAPCVTSSGCVTARPLRRAGTVGRQRGQRRSGRKTPVLVAQGGATFPVAHPRLGPPYHDGEVVWSRLVGYGEVSARVGCRSLGRREHLRRLVRIAAVGSVGVGPGARIGAVEAGGPPAARSPPEAVCREPRTNKITPAACAAKNPAGPACGDATKKATPAARLRRASPRSRYVLTANTTAAWAADPIARIRSPSGPFELRARNTQSRRAGTPPRHT